MKYKFLLLAIFILTGAFLFQYGTGKQVPGVYGVVIVARDGGDFNNLQAGVNYAYDRSLVTSKPWSVQLNPGVWPPVIMKPGINVVGADRYTTIIESKGGQIAMLGAAGAVPQNLTLRAYADAGGDGIAYHANDVTALLDGVTIELRRGANRAFGVYDRGDKSATITLRNVRIAGPERESRGIQLGDGGGGSNKQLLVHQSWIDVAHNAITHEGQGSLLDIRDSFFGGSNDAGAIALQAGGMIRNTHIMGSLVMAAGASNQTLGLWSTTVEGRLRSDKQNSRIYAFDSYVRALRTSVPTARVEWYGGDINVVDEATGPIVWREDRFRYRVLWPMQINDTINAVLADQPAPSATYRYVINVGPGPYESMPQSLPHVTINYE